MTLVITDEYEGGDPGAPLGCTVAVLDSKTVLCEMWFPNEDNEELQQVIIDAVEKRYECNVRRKSNVDPDYGYW